MREQDAPITADHLLAPCDGERTEEGMRANIRVAVQYIEAWISGNGCVPIYGLMEDAATAEISVPQSGSGSIIKNVEQWQTGDQSLVPPDAGRRDESHCQRTGRRTFLPGRFDDAARLMEQITTSDELIDFLTLPGYRLLA